ncbi:RsmB/NOP family class I SAM-dependent RNA methyltransferase [Tessaracoccus sp. OS52]|uniref:RsmB/NOP family class I SAM-dependent RNA methyltransferase n=1 Tax=Tessaracoccus sp. OS52 TaxID=2886691 RepID=UPI001D0FCD43|nr:RsmB/NOP family class I SAM-dependent RNA methyltransferase [Tessaracoccus sp. OS52]
MTAPSPRRVAFDVLRQVTGEDAYANLALSKRLATAGLDSRDAGFVTELVSGTCRLLGTYDRIIEAAGGRALSTLQPAVVDLLRLGSHQALSMDVPGRAAVATTVDLARETVGQRVTGVINAILRKVAAKSLDEWTRQLADGAQGVERLAVEGHHPVWVAQAYADVLPDGELSAALAANNVAPTPTLVVRPGLLERDELVRLGGEPTGFSPFGASFDGQPGSLEPVRDGRAGVQDEGSQLVAWALARVDAPAGPWLDLCAGPGGKAALLAGLARESGEALVANEVAEHRAQLVEQALSAYPEGTATVVCSDGRRPEALADRGPYARVMVDAPCTGLGALRRRPESRWRRSPDDVAQLAGLQRDLLRSAISLTAPGGVVAYVTCSPHRAETRDVVAEVLADGGLVELLHASDYLPPDADAGEGDFVQLWPHRHGTDAMFLALLRFPA